MNRNRRSAAVPILLSASVISISLGLAARTYQLRQQENRSLPTGRNLIQPGVGTSVGSFPTNIVLSPDGRWLAVTTSGAREFLSILSATDGSVVSQLSFNQPADPKPAGGPVQQTLYVGLAFSPTTEPADGSFMLYVSRGGEDRVSVMRVSDNGTLTDTGRALNNPPHAVGAQPAHANFIAHIALNSTGTVLYAANNETGDWTHYKGSVSVIDIASNRVIGKVNTPGFPYAVAAVTRGPEADKRVYVASERDAVVSAIDVSDSAKPQFVNNIPVGSHPDALLFNTRQTYLFVANASSDSVSIIDTSRDRVVKTLSLRPRDSAGLAGMTPTGLCLSPDESTLYVTLADWNAVAVVRLAGIGRSPAESRNRDDILNAASAASAEHASPSMKLAGFVPSGWYPTAVQASKDGARIFVANAKGGEATHPNGTVSGPKGEWGHYIERIIDGTVGILRAPDASELAQTSREVAESEHPWGLQADAALKLAKSGVRHVFYIIKENRTYDQVLGDVNTGNGDPSLTLYGCDVTPNIHALAERFVLLDNFYDCAEVSADGWNWSTSGMTTEYEQRNTRINYSGRGRDYDFEGATNGAPVDLMGINDVNEAPGGYIWDQCRKHDISYRGYGFYVSFGDFKSAEGKVLAKDNTPLRRALVGHSDDNYLQFDLSYADSDAWVKWNIPAASQKLSYGEFKAPSRFAEWQREFHIFEQNDNLPTFEMLRLPVDHTAGTRVGARSPRALVADNDYAVGQIVQEISNSRYWKDSAIFVIEDDAQDGYDHVDAHRSICLVISPRIRRSSVDHHFYNTDSVLRTMESLLGLPPMNEYDAWAPPITSFQTTGSNDDTYQAILPAREIISQVNQKTAYRSKDSMRLDFSQADRVPDQTLNDILWHDAKGPDRAAPTIRHTLVLTKLPPRDNN